MSPHAEGQELPPSNLRAHHKRDQQLEDLMLREFYRDRHWI